MPLYSRVLDLGLNVLDTEANRLDLCSAEPTTYAAATSTLTLANKTALSIGAPADASPNGRQVTVPAITDGTITATDTATWYAITDTVNSRLLAASTITSRALVSGDTFTTDSFTIRIPSN